MQLPFHVEDEMYGMTRDNDAIKNTIGHMHVDGTKASEQSEQSDTIANARKHSLPMIMMPVGYSSLSVITDRPVVAVLS
ncbi:hypothetical protein VSDG_02388 [Cytospora chrysosperma]|uniref:Uncharacterized protein n=1 Tax=Cytospora chrysosperma TaxID=252740 RepID=A0A423WFF6_CYTCH|nr:hypothetical protein VSDG_02388 [Valsa sordida]